MKRHSKTGRFVADNKTAAKKPAPRHAGPPGASKPGGVVKRGPLSGSERYRAHDDLIAALDQMTRDGEAE